MNRIGIFGGTFNPIHNGHLMVAEDIRERFGLNKLFFVPCCLPPHKTAGSLIPAKDRLSMVEAAVADNPAFVCSKVEIERKGISFSIDTIRHFQQEHGNQTEIFFIVGVDAFADIDTWHETDSLFTLCRFIVLRRSFINQNKLEKQLHEIKNKYRLHYGDNPKDIKENQVLLVNTPLIDISSSDIRKRIAQKISIKYLVPETVEKYIIDNRLYRVS